MTEGNAHRWRRTDARLDRATLMELFFDLAFVLVLFQMSGYLAEHLSWRGALETVVLTAAVWWVWTMITWLTNTFHSADPNLQILVTVFTFGVIAMGVAIPGAFDGHGIMFAVAYVGVHLVRSGAQLVAARGDTMRRVPLRLLLWALATAPLWLIGATLPGEWRLVLWAVAIVVDYEGAAVGWPVPLLGRVPLERWQVGGEHLAERYRQILLIGVGDTFLTMSAAWNETPATPLRVTTLALTFVYMSVLLQSYYRVASERLAEMIARSRNKARAARLAVDCHLLMLLGIVGTSTSIGLKIRHPLGHPHGFWIVVIVAGPALFVLGRILFGRLVLGRLSPSRVIALIGLLAMTPAAGVLPPVLSGVVTTAVLALILLPRISRRFARLINEPVLEER